MLIFVGLLQAAILAFTILAIKRQTTANITSQRAWILAEVQFDAAKWADGKGHVLEGRSLVEGRAQDNTAVYLQLVCRNEGNSPAWIEEKRMKFEIFSTLPKEPPLGSADIIYAGNEPLGIGKTDDPITKESAAPIAEGRPELGKIMCVYGGVTYRDIFGKQRSTTFGYQISASQELNRLSGYPAWNRST